MRKYEDRVITEDVLFYELKSFCFIEGQHGLPEPVKELYNKLHDNRLGSEVYLLQNVFEYPDKIKAIPFINPDVIVFQTTMINIDKIEYIIEYLEKSKYRPKEIWQLIRNDIPIVDSDKYNVFSFYIDDRSIITTKL